MCLIVSTSRTESIQIIDQEYPDRIAAISSVSMPSWIILIHINLILISRKECEWSGPGETRPLKEPDDQFSYFN